MERTKRQWMPFLPEEITRLSELAYNLWFGGSENAKQLFQMIDEAKWDEMKHNPVRLIFDTPLDRWSQLIKDVKFMDKYTMVMRKFDEYMHDSTWFQQRYPGFEGKFAYFSAEFGFHESLPIYSGGLGILAGDHCKSASDLGVPLIGVGLLYKKGYFRQKFDSEGRQHADFFEYIFEKLPIQPAYVEGDELVIKVTLPGRDIQLKVWQVQIGRMIVYLLDSDLQVNSQQDRELTAQLYGGNHETRIQQEILLGVGGIRMLRAFHIYPKAYHINEGHAAFISLERLREYIHQGIRYQNAIELIRSSTIFTTHTPVPAGHDVFPMSTFEYHMGPLLSQMETERERIIRLGLDREKDQYNMTFLGLNTAVYRNGVSKLHGHVSREMFHDFHGDMLLEEVPIESITNGVHLKTWISKELKDLFSRYLPANWQINQTDTEIWKALDELPNQLLWNEHMHLKERLIDHARANLELQRRRNGESEARINEVQLFLDPKVLTIGFARRFATYKRSTMVFNDLDRLNRLVNHPERPVQFIFAGKSHPADHPGQELIREIYRISQLESFKGKIVILENYDIKLARSLVQGVDVWLNNPKRPLEASGTSGMKAAFNGVINFSVLDGWWEEGYNGDNGWEITSNYDAPWDIQEHENTISLYETLENQIAPMYYNQHNGLPNEWVVRMKNSIQSLAPVYNTDRMVQDYTNHYYVPTGLRFDRFSNNEAEIAMRFADYKAFLIEHWDHVRVVWINDQVEHLQNGMKVIAAVVNLGSIPARSVAVEAIYHKEQGGKWIAVRVPLDFQFVTYKGDLEFRGVIPGGLSHASHYTVRIRPYHPEFAHLFDLPLLVRSWV
jgi:starch phosphorylase